MNSHLVSQAYLFYSFPSHDIHISGRLYIELFGKVYSYQDFINEMLSKTRQASHGLTRQKGHWKIMLYQGGGEKNTHT
jgi:hypothetical protein